MTKQNQPESYIQTPYTHDYHSHLVITIPHHTKISSKPIMNNYRPTQVTQP